MTEEMMGRLVISKEDEHGETSRFASNPYLTTGRPDLYVVMSILPFAPQFVALLGLRDVLAERSLEESVAQSVIAGDHPQDTFTFDQRALRGASESTSQTWHGGMPVTTNFHQRKTHAPRSRRLARISVLVGAVTLVAADRACVVSPTTDTIVTASSVRIEGTLTEFDNAGNMVANHDGRVRLALNGANLAWVTTSNKVWTYSSVALNTGVNRFAGTTSRTGPGGANIAGTVPPFLLERKTDLSDQGTQRVYFGVDWSDPGIDEMLKNMARHTLEPDPSAADLEFFASEVRRRVQAFVINAYADKKIEVVATPGADVAMIKFYGLSESVCGLYGLSYGDYENQTKGDVSHVYIRTFECTVVDDDELLNGTPARTTDALAQRITDIATFIGRTAAHELGHSLGLVAEGTGDTRLHGCDGWHNCDAYDNANPSDRFDGGHYIMDPGPKSPVYARIGQASAAVRGSQRPKFNAYNESYLSIIH
jgi:hypothetical protein